MLRSITQVTEHDPSKHMLVQEKEEKEVTKGLKQLHIKDVIKCSVVSVDRLTKRNARYHEPTFLE